MADVILVLNAGSSSLKYCAYDAQGDALRLVLRGSIDGLYTSPSFRAANGGGTEVEARHWDEGTELGHAGGIAFLADFLRGHGEGHHLVGVGHRVVHGGVRFTQPERVTEAVLSELDALCPLAPLHQPHNLKPIRILAERRPELPQVACFDTAFHRAQPEIAQAFALPASMTERGIRRYGFHGLSYEYIASVLPGVDATAAAGRTVVAHLGNGSSMCALVAGRSVASTMGFTAVDGLPMGTRCGSLDPGVILYLMSELGMDAHEIEDLIYRKSGLLGVSGISSDMRVLLDSDDPRAALPWSCIPTDRTGAWVARCSGARHRRAALHRGHWRACRPDPGTRVPPGDVAWGNGRLRGQYRRRDAYQRGIRTGCGMGDPDGRRTDDRQAYQGIDRRG